MPLPEFTAGGKGNGPTRRPFLYLPKLICRQPSEVLPLRCQGRQQSIAPLVELQTSGDTLPGRPAANLDKDLRVAEHVVTVLARRRQKMPLTVGFMQAVSLQGFGHKVGEHRAARMIHHLRFTNRLTPVGRYRGNPHGFFVTIYRLRDSVSSSVRRKAVVKSREWWEHGLFGNPNGEEPVGYTEQRVKRWKQREWRLAEIIRAAS